MSSFVAIVMYLFIYNKEYVVLVNTLSVLIFTRVFAPSPSPIYLLVSLIHVLIIPDITSWVNKVIGTFSFSRRLLAWDSFECHMMNSVKYAISKLNIDQVIVPGGCTKYVQAPDVCWNKPFKAVVTEQYDEWMASGLQQYTEAGNLRPPSRKNIVQ